MWSRSNHKKTTADMPQGRPIVATYVASPFIECALAAGTVTALREGRFGPVAEWLHRPRKGRDYRWRSSRDVRHPSGSQPPSGRGPAERKRGCGNPRALE